MLSRVWYSEMAIFGRFWQVSLVTSVACCLVKADKIWSWILGPGPLEVDLDLLKWTWTFWGNNINEYQDKDAHL